MRVVASCSGQRISRSHLLACEDALGRCLLCCTSSYLAIRSRSDSVCAFATHLCSVILMF